MEPKLKEHQKVLIQKTWFFCKLNVNDIVTLHDPRNRRTIIKRVAHVRQSENNNKEYFVLGDNKKESTDSKTFGWIKEKNIIGKIIKAH